MSILYSNSNQVAYTQHTPTLIAFDTNDVKATVDGKSESDYLNLILREGAKINLDIPS